MGINIIIKKSEATRTLTELADVNEEVLSLHIPTANMSAAQTELGTINTDNWTASTQVTESNGNTSDSLVLPKEALG